MASLKKYFIRHEDGSYTFNNAAFQPITNKAGLFVLVSDSVKNAEQAYHGYKSSSIVEKYFKNLKVRMACDRLYLSCEKSLPGKLFVQFIALTLCMHLLYTLRKRKE